MPKCDARRAEKARHRCSKCEVGASVPPHKARGARGRSTNCSAGDNPTLKRHVAIELAFERASAKVPKPEVPEDAVCYICLDGGDILRGCACRGASAGFAHVVCLAEMAKRNAWMTAVGQRRLSRWTTCGLCQQEFTGALMIEMQRRMWRHCRDAPVSDGRRAGLADLARTLRRCGEDTAANVLDEDAMQGLPPEDPFPYMAQLTDTLLHTNPAAALKLLTALQPMMERCDDAGIQLTYNATMADALHKVGRFDDALGYSAESARLSTAIEGTESRKTLSTMENHATTLLCVGRVGEAKAKLTQVLAARTRLLGAEHPETRYTKQKVDRLSALGA